MLSIWISLEFCHLVKSELCIKQQNFWPVEIESTCRQQDKCDSETEIFFGKGRKRYGKSRKC